MFKDVKGNTSHESSHDYLPKEKPLVFQKAITFFFVSGLSSLSSRYLRFNLVFGRPRFLNSPSTCLERLSCDKHRWNWWRCGVVFFWEEVSVILVAWIADNTYPPWKLTARPWKWMVGIRAFPFGGRPIFRCELLVSGRVCDFNLIIPKLGKLSGMEFGLCSVLQGTLSHVTFGPTLRAKALGF